MPQHPSFDQNESRNIDGKRPAPGAAGSTAPRRPFFDSAEPGLGVLNPNAGREKFRLLRYSPAPELADLVRHYWTVDWDLGDSAAYRQEVVPNPCVNLVIEPGRTFCFAPTPERFSYPLSGRGKVFGVKFRPGGFYPLLRRPLSDFAGIPIPVDRIIAAEAKELEEALHSRTSEELVDLLDALLLGAAPERDRESELAREIADRIAEDRELTKVDALCEAFSIEKRTLQRLFGSRIGLSPKWVIRLHRLQEAAEALESRGSDGARPKLLALSHDLGYHDQTHFIKDFKSVIGVTPEAYALGARSR
ncbi:helix-turn-helix domain-containing protein [Saccharibacillus sp. CPCC 101409]|uniref:AraC family transcriptional regulator n=1 Tax=Saccharibacillus sp. CPCC 101409 TaxID=3058041 RepID=UPI00267214A1|nr:helix-turn-helix domain-containing protein [Saccharibacillus sp. CPCC 101409]MDO3411613.1 helix-turn-helix domain-containing protein [Saccharibacillus sp. CPCC 101409]